MEWSAGVTTAPTGSALPPGDRQEIQSSTALQLTEPHVAFKHSFRLYFWSIVVAQFKRNVFKPAETGVGQTGLQCDSLMVIILTGSLFTL